MEQLLLPALDSWTHESRLWEKQHYILDTGLANTSILEDTASAPGDIGAITESSKGHPTILSSQLTRDDGEHGKTREVLERRRTAAFTH